MSAAEARPLFDEARLAELELVLGGDRVAILLAAFGRELRSRPAIMRECARRDDRGSVRKEAHLFRGAALSIGAMASASLGADLEHATDAAMDDVLRRFEEVAERTLAALGHPTPAWESRSLLSQAHF